MLKVDGSQDWEIYTNRQCRQSFQTGKRSSGIWLRARNKRVGLKEFENSGK